MVTKNEEVKEKRVGRREVLRMFGVGIGAAGGLIALGATPASAADVVCKGRVELDEAAAATRRSSQYRDKALVAEQDCTKCSQWVDAKYGECGGCLIVPGAVAPKGGCLGFAPKK
jgi:hypothetical protein